ncbi:eCIS core domain-containing protein [Desulfuromonas acetexigens]|uniref:DUF4157 domain-containing protein n=1 Tax=Trichloromonas acetexigens TaxID=38815 RepID=A0A550JHI4_9BACT|nr:DUF4157 domain-containing protein [Desulfuromonas acetexigens]TRO82675.1 DUF4157 domain-containing protein [Desulfuromonas acetexigens]
MFPMCLVSVRVWPLPCCYGSSGGRELLAHELAHVVQQQAGPRCRLLVGGAEDENEREADQIARQVVADETRMAEDGDASSPDTAGASGTIRRRSVRGVLQRDADSEARAQQARARHAELDRFEATLVSALNVGVASHSPDILISYAGSMGFRYRQAIADERPETRIAVATVLARIHTALAGYAETAERDVDGALLMESFGGELHPWTSARPQSLEEIPPFTLENLAAWRADAALGEARAATERAASRRGTARREQPAPPPLMDPGEARTFAPLAPREAAGATAAAQPRTPEEEVGQAAPGGGRIVRDGLATLAATPLRSVAGPSPSAGTSSGRSEGASLLDASLHIWFVSNRLYVVDRSGHLAPGEESWFDLSAMTGMFSRGGVFFLLPVETRVGGRSIHFEVRPVSGGAGGALGGIYPARTLTGLIPLLELRQAARSRNAGIGLIVAPNIGGRLTWGDLSFERISQALDRTPRHMEWAILSEWARIRRDPLGEAANQLVGLGISYAARALPPVGAAAFAYQALRFSAWLGDVANVAGYARTDDEIDIAAQAIARKLASFVVSEAISRGICGVGRVGAGVARGRGERSGGAREGRRARIEDEASSPGPRPPARRSEPEPLPSREEPSVTARPAEPPPTSTRPPRRAPDEASPDESAASAERPAATTARPAVPPPTSRPLVHALDDVLTADRGRFDVNNPAVQARLSAPQLEALLRLQAAYERYRSRRVGEGRDALSPEQWARAVTSGQPRRDAELLFGRDYARTGRGGAAARPAVRLSEIPRPANYDDRRLATDLAVLRGESGLWDCLGRLRQRGVAGNEVNASLFNILKGNIAEILARPILHRRLAEVRVQHPGARVEYRTRVARVRGDGGHRRPVLFSDGLIVSERNGRLIIHEAFEVKSGSRGGAEATSQFFEWREGRLADGDQLVLADGRRFTYEPGRTGAGYVEGMQQSTPHVIAPRGSEHLGTTSGEQVAAAGVRHALGQTASEIDFLARRILEGLSSSSSSAAAAAPASATE